MCLWPWCTCLRKRSQNAVEAMHRRHLSSTYKAIMVNIKLFPRTLLFLLALTDRASSSPTAGTPDAWVEPDMGTVVLVWACSSCF